MEKAFKINPNSDLWNKYFAEKEEKRKFFDLSEAFRNKYELTERFEKMRHYRISNFRACLSKESYEKYKSQIKAKQNSDCSYDFKVKSEINQAWRDEVWNKLDTKAINATNWWFMECDHGMKIRNRLFEIDGQLLAWIESEKVGALPDSIELKLSEYHAIIEAYSAKIKEYDNKNEN